MLNEERVKHMVKLALYETKNGTEELKTSSYYKRDYISVHVLWSLLMITVAYVLLVALLMISFMSVLIENFHIALVVVLGVIVIAIYVGLLITYMMVTRKLYKKKHADAYHRVKQFKEDLIELELMYGKEDTNGEIIGD